jgi:hypothetical protein
MIVNDVMDRLVAAAATAVGVPALVLTQYGYVPDKIEAPCVFAQLKPIEFDKTFGRGTDEMFVTIHVRTSRTSDREGQRLLNSYLDGSGASSIKAAMEAAKGAPGALALAGACDDFHVQRVSEPTEYTHGGIPYLGAEFTVRVIGSGT